MNTEGNLEKSLHAEIEALREKFPNTQEIYYEACILLFFRHGITPTANKLYQLVRKGSMSAPAEALGKFWSNLREKSAVRIEHPDLPNELKIAAGDLVSTLWSQSQSLAQESFSTLRDKAHASVLEAEARQSDAESLLENAKKEVHKATIAIDNNKLRISELEQNLAGEVATRKALEAQLSQAKQTAVEQQKAMDDARLIFSSELEILRESLKVTEERYRAAESRALLEIDRERIIATKLQKELEQARSTVTEITNTHRAEVRSLHDEIGNLKQRQGNIEGELRAVAASKELLINELDKERQSVRDLSSRLIEAAKEAEVWQQKATDAHKEIESLLETMKRKARKITK